MRNVDRVPYKSQKKVSKTWNLVQDLNSSIFKKKYSIHPIKVKNSIHFHRENPVNPPLCTKLNETFDRIKFPPLITAKLPDNFEPLSLSVYQPVRFDSGYVAILRSYIIRASTGCHTCVSTFYRSFDTLKIIARKRRLRDTALPLSLPSFSPLPTLRELVIIEKIGISWPVDVLMNINAISTVYNNVWTMAGLVIGI